MLLLLVILPDGAAVEELRDLVAVHKRPLHRLQGLHHLVRGEDMGEQEEQHCKENKRE